MDKRMHIKPHLKAKEIHNKTYKQKQITRVYIDQTDDVIDKLNDEYT